MFSEQFNYHYNILVCAYIYIYIYVYTWFKLVSTYAYIHNIWLEEGDALTLHYYILRRGRAARHDTLIMIASLLHVMIL